MQYALLSENVCEFASTRTTSSIYNFEGQDCFFWSKWVKIWIWIIWLLTITNAPDHLAQIPFPSPWLVLARSRCSLNHLAPSESHSEEFYKIQRKLKQVLSRNKHNVSTYTDFVTFSAKLCSTSTSFMVDFDFIYRWSQMYIFSRYDKCGSRIDWWCLYHCLCKCIVTGEPHLHRRPHASRSDSPRQCH